MKYFIIITFFTLLSCSRSVEKTKIPNTNTSKESLSNQEDTIFMNRKNESEFLEKISYLIKNKVTVKESNIFICVEDTRRNIQNACYTLGAIQRGYSDLFIEKLSEIIEQRVELLPLIFFQDALLKKKPFSFIESKLRQRPSDPVWFQAKLINLWINQNPRLKDDARDYGAMLISKAILHPIDISELSLLLKMVDETLWEKFFYMNCDPNLEGIARFRCWRFISSIEKKEILNSLELYLPQKNDNDWILFKRIYTHRAHLIEDKFSI